MFFHLNQKDKSNSQNKEDEDTDEEFRFKSKKCPPQIDEMKKFEEDMWTMIETLKYRYPSSNFQKKLSQDIKQINKSTKAFISADKTQNYYQLNKEDHDKILKDNVTKSIRKHMPMHRMK